MARWAALIENRRNERPALLVDAGDFCPINDKRDQELANKYFFEALKKLRYDALAVGEKEILFGRSKLLEAADRQKLALVSANVRDKETGRPLTTPNTVKVVGGKRRFFRTVGGIKVGIFSVASPDLLYAPDRFVQKYYDVVDPRIAALEAVSELRAKGCDVIVALSHQDWNESVELARTVPGLDIVVSSHGSRMKTVSERIGSALVVGTGDNNTSFTEIEVAWEDGRTEAVAVDQGEVLRKIEDHPDFLELEKAFRAEIREIAGEPRESTDPIKKEKTPAKKRADGR
jgi:2',3'-cyclic-nucleotide 2'-phosphodiesterase (5'-nucleotidase family)